MTDSIIYFFVKGFGFFIRSLPVGAALWVGRTIGVIGYYFDAKHRAITYSNLKIAFAKTKTPDEISRIAKEHFKIYGQNLIELFRLPLMANLDPQKFVKIAGQEHIHEALKKQKGVIILAMHFGSWEITCLMGKILNHSYSILAKSQDKFLQSYGLLNRYREIAGASVIMRGRGTREVIKNLRRNEIVGMVVDQGGRDGVLVKFFGKSAAMSVGALKLGLKFDIPICFAMLTREKISLHRGILHSPLNLIKTGDIEKDVVSNLDALTKLMEQCITQYPTEYMWFYKIWKYSKDAALVILNDGKVGHLRQSQAISQVFKKAANEKGIELTTHIVDIQFKSRLAQKIFSACSFLAHPNFFKGRLWHLQWFLTPKSYLKISSVKANYVVSCGSSVAGVNSFLSCDNQAKSICILKPGMLGFCRFHLIVLPQHDKKPETTTKGNVAIVLGAANLITPEYLKEQSSLLVQRFAHLSGQGKLRIGFLLGGDSKKYFIDKEQIKVVIAQLKSACEKIGAEILVTTSRRTPKDVEDVMQNEFSTNKQCPLFIKASENTIPEAVGGILGLSDIIVVSGESISMVSEAASSGKNVVVFMLKKKHRSDSSRGKHEEFVDKLSTEGYIVLAHESNLSDQICAISQKGIKTKTLDNRAAIFDAVKFVI